MIDNRKKRNEYQTLVLTTQHAQLSIKQRNALTVSHEICNWCRAKTKITTQFIQKLISTLKLFFNDWSLSYIVFALVETNGRYRIRKIVHSVLGVSL